METSTAEQTREESYTKQKDDEVELQFTYRPEQVFEFAASLSFEAQENKEFLHRDLNSLTRDLKKVSIEFVPVKLTSLKKWDLVDLSLIDCHISASECQIISGMKSLRHLNLSCNAVGQAGLQNLMKKKLKLETLIMYNCQIANQKVAKNNNKMEMVEKLKHLNFSYNPEVVEKVNQQVWQALVSDSLLELTLSNCAIKNINGLTRILKSAPNLESLDISGNSSLIFNQQLADALSKCPLRTLLANKCSLNFETLNMEHLLRLDFSNTLKKDTCDFFVSGVLPHCNLPSLEILLFDQNHLTSESLQILFSLESLLCLQILSVKNNKITRVEGPFNDLAYTPNKPLEQCMDLKVLDLTDNKLNSVKFPRARRFLATTIVVNITSKNTEQEFENYSLEKQEEKSGYQQWMKKVIQEDGLLNLNFENGMQIIQNPNREQLELLNKLNFYD